jgi:hypothetical protein
MQSDLIKEFNRQLASNPDYILPDGYKKVNVPDVTFKFQCIVSVPVAHRMAYEIVHLLVEKVGSALIEPITVKTNNFKARPNTFGYIQSKLGAPK